MKKLSFFFALVMLNYFCAAQSTFCLPPTTAVFSGVDFIPICQSNATKKISLTNLKTFINTGYLTTDGATIGGTAQIQQFTNGIKANLISEITALDGIRLNSTKGVGINTVPTSLFHVKSNLGDDVFMISDGGFLQFGTSSANYFLQVFNEDVYLGAVATGGFVHLNEVIFSYKNQAGLEHLLLDAMNGTFSMKLPIPHQTGEGKIIDYDFTGVWTIGDKDQVNTGLVWIADIDNNFVHLDNTTHDAIHKINGSDGASGSGNTVTSVGGIVTAIANNAITDADITSLSWSKITSTPTTLIGYGIADPIALTTSTLAQFTSTSSAQLRTLLSDELGTGAALFDGATPTSFVLTNATGLVATTGLTATGTKNSTTFLRGDDTWATPAGGAGLTVGTSAIASGVATRLLYETSGNVLGEISGATSDGTNLFVPTLYGGTASGGDLTFSSTAHATKGNIFFGTSTYDEVDNRLGINSVSPSSALDVHKDQNGVTQNDANGISLMNITPAILGTQSISPPLVWQGLGWATTSSTSRDVRWRIDALPQQGATNPTSVWQLAFSVNGGAYSNQLTMSSLGTFTVTGGVVATTGAFSSHLIAGTTSSCLNVTSTTGTSGSISTSQYLFAGASNVNFRVGLRGSTNSNITVGNSYSTLIIGDNAIVEAASGTHALLAQQVIKVLTISNAAGATTNTAGLYIEGAPTGITPAGANYALWSDAGINRFDGETVHGSTIQLMNYTVATLPAGTQGMICYVTDALAPAYLTAVVGGGAVVTPVFYNGAAWIAH